MTGDRPSSSTYVRALERGDPAVTVLCVTPDESTLGDLADGLESAEPGVEAFEARTTVEAFHVLEAEDVGCVVSTLDLGDTDGLDFLAQVRQAYGALPFVLLAEDGSEPVAAEAVNAGVDGYVPYEGDPGRSEFETLVDRIETVVDDYRSHQRFEDATELLFRLTEYTTDTLWMFTGDWSETVVINDAYEDIWGRSQAGVVADPGDFLEGVHPADRELVREKMAVLSSGEPTDLEFRVDPGDGVDWVSVHAEPVVVDGEVEYVAGYTRDVTERHKRERALDELQAVARDMMSADSRAEVADITTDATERAVDFSIAAVRLLDDDRLRVAGVPRHRVLARVRPLPPVLGITGVRVVRVFRVQEAILVYRLRTWRNV